METILSSIQNGLIFAILGLGVYISFRVLNIPDLTIDGTFSLGALVSMIVVNALTNYLGLFLGLLLSFLAGGFFGLITGIIHTKLKINAVLASILAMTALYTINLRLNGGNPSGYVINPLFGNIYSIDGLGKNIIILSIIVFVIFLFIYLFFRLRIGLSIRATGDNETMVKSSSINPNHMKVLGLILANGLSGLSGGLYTLFTTTYDSTLGNGRFVMAVAGIIIGEAILLFKGNFKTGFISVLLGSIIYQILFAIALKVGAEAIDLKLISAIIIIIAISIPLLLEKLKERVTRVSD